MITLCVPTMNRPQFLERLLRYYAQTRSPYAVLIGDSSTAELAEQNQRMVASFERQLRVTYRAYPGLSACAALEQLAQEISTPYCAFVGDDDVLCTRGLKRCAAFLESHPDVGAAHGAGLMVQTEGSGPYGPLGNVRPYPQALVEATTGAQRLEEFFTLRLSSVLYSVHRRQTWQTMFQSLGAMPGVQNRNMFKDELIATSISVIRGQIACVEGLYLIRHVHADDSYRFPHVYDWLTDPMWFPSYQTFCERLVEQLVHQDGITVDEARQAIRRAFWPYLAREVSVTRRKEIETRATSAPSPLRAMAKRLPGARQAWQGLRAMVQRSRDPWSLPALLQPSSPYHEDFLPVYRLITSPIDGRAIHPSAAPPELDIAMAGSAGAHSR